VFTPEPLSNQFLFSVISDEEEKRERTYVYCNAHKCTENKHNPIPIGARNDEVCFSMARRSTLSTNAIVPNLEEGHKIM
jgi:hypothetical protein